MLLADVSLPAIPFTSALYTTVIATAVLAIVVFVLAIATNKVRPAGTKRFLLTKLLYAAFLVTVVVLSLSSFASIVRFGHMSGYALLAHIGAAGAFTFLLLAVAFSYLPRGASGDESLPADTRWWFARWTAWLLILSSLVTAATMFLSMLPILDTQGLVFVLGIHRFAGLTVAAAAVLHAMSLAIVRLGAR